MRVLINFALIAPLLLGQVSNSSKRTEIGEKTGISLLHGGPFINYSGMVYYKNPKGDDAFLAYIGSDSSAEYVGSYKQYQIVYVTRFAKEVTRPSLFLFDEKSGLANRFELNSSQFLLIADNRYCIFNADMPDWSTPLDYHSGLIVFDLKTWRRYRVLPEVYCDRVVAISPTCLRIYGVNNKSGSNVVENLVLTDLPKNLR